jgi:hypothetical protein
VEDVKRRALDRRVGHVQAGRPRVLDRHPDREFVELFPGPEVGGYLINALGNGEDARAAERGRTEEFVPDGIDLPFRGGEEPEAVGAL